ncbi:MAG: hypothetical protein HY731_02575 [Candidatus Tectomicrobia bacterium]|nr:hypothetical protein [Candidatus Tectomicrobia bacterium]
MKVMIGFVVLFLTVILSVGPSVQLAYSGAAEKIDIQKLKDELARLRLEHAKLHQFMDVVLKGGALDKAPELKAETQRIHSMWHETAEGVEEIVEQVLLKSESAGN